MKALFIVNLAIAGFGLVAHGTLLGAQLYGSSGPFISYLVLIPIVAAEVLLIVTSITGLLGNESLSGVCLKLQSLVLGAFGLLVIFLLFRALPFGTSPGTGFWVPVVGSGFVAYCTYLLLRAFPRVATFKPSQAALLTGVTLFAIELAVVLG